jgi:hypothetical protein
LGWLTFLSPALTHHLLPYILSAGLGEVALAPWLPVAPRGRRELCEVERTSTRGAS